MQFLLEDGRDDLFAASARVARLTRLELLQIGKSAPLAFTDLFAVSSGRFSRDVRLCGLG